jgi:hypothetical protein
VEPQNTVQLGKQAVAESAAAGIPYQVLRQDAAGEFVPAAAGAVFRPGESLRLRFEPTREGILAVTDPDSRAQLYHGRVESGKPVIVPASGSLKLSDEPGVRRLGVRFTSAGTLRSMLSQESAVRGAVPVAAPAAVQFEIVLRYR